LVTDIDRLDLSAVQDSKDPHYVVVQSIGSDTGGATNNKFASAGDSADPTASWNFKEPVHCACDLFVHVNGGKRNKDFDMAKD
jgi:hypothetical protein